MLNQVPRAKALDQCGIALFYHHRNGKTRRLLATKIDLQPRAQFYGVTTTLSSLLIVVCRLELTNGFPGTENSKPLP